MAAVSAPVLSQKKQNKSVAKKKKSLKTIRNLITAPEAIFWPVLNEENEKNEISKLIKTLSRQIETKSEKRADHKKIDIKFGVNEISRKINQSDCKAILLDTAVPRILVFHLLSIATIKQIPILCLDDLSNTINGCFGFKSSSICFIKSSDPKTLKICEYIGTYCMKYYKSHYEVIIDDKDKVCKENTPTGTCSASSVSDKEENSKHQTGPSDFLQFTKEPKKRKLVFQPLLIKRVCTNPRRRNKNITP